MELQRERKKTGCLRGIGVVLLSLIAAFMLFMSLILFLVGNMGVGISSALIGVFFALLALFARRQSHLRGKILLGFTILLGGGLLVAILCVFLFAMFIKPFVDMEHYLQVWQNPVTVTAEVTKHTPYDDDGDTDYQSFVTYVYKDTRYKDYLYEDRDKEEDLTPVGTVVEIQISPKDPARQIADLKANSRSVPFSIFIVFLGIAALYVSIQRWWYPKNSGIPDMETIHRDMKKEIRCRMARPCLLLCWMGYGLLYWRYSVLLGWKPLIIAGVSFLGWLYCMYTTVRDYRRVENEEFEVCRDVLVDKKEDTDADSNTSYWLHYQNGDRIWKSSVNRQKYDQATIGDAIMAVYLPGKKKPIVYYDLSSKLN